MARQSKGYGAKVGATAIIWSFGTGMLAICIPLVPITKSGVVLPLATILGASVSTVAVWRSSQQKSGSMFELADRVKSLSDRLEIVEEICSTNSVELPPNQPLQLKDRSRSV